MNCHHIRAVSGSARGKFMKIRTSLLLLVVFLISLAGCAQKEEQKELVIDDFKPLTEIVEGRPNIYYISKVTSDNNYWNVVAKCMKKSATELNCNLYYSGSRVEAEWEAQLVLLNQAVEKKADAIIIAPGESTMLSEPIERVYKMGIPIVLIDTVVTKDEYDACAMTDNLYAGEMAAKEMLKQLKKANNDEQNPLTVAIHVGWASSQTISERMAGFTKYWFEHAPGKWKIADDVKSNNGDVELAIKLTDDLLTEYPDLKGIFGCNNGSTVGVVRSVVQNNRKDIVVVGFDYSTDMASMIANEDYRAATMLQRQNEMVRIAIETALQRINGNEVTTKFIDTGVVVVNDETVNDPDVQAIISLN